MERVSPCNTPFNAVDQWWLAIFTFQAVLLATTSVLHIVASPRHCHPHLVVPWSHLLALHPLLSSATIGLLALAFVISTSPHMCPPPLQRVQDHTNTHATYPGHDTLPHVAPSPSPNPTPHRSGRILTEAESMAGESWKQEAALGGGQTRPWRGSGQ